VVVDFLNQNKNPAEKHIHTVNKLFSPIHVKTSLAYGSKRKPEKLGSAPKPKLDGLQNLTKQMTDS